MAQLYVRQLLAGRDWVDVEDADRVAGEGEGEGELRRYGRLADAALAGEDLCVSVSAPVSRRGKAAARTSTMCLTLSRLMMSRDLGRVR